MHPMRLGRTILATAILAASAAIPTSVAAQTPYRAACDLLSDAAVSSALGAEVTAQRTGTRSQCYYSGPDGGLPVSIWLNGDADLSTFSSQDGVEPITLAGLEGVWWPSQNRLIVALADGGLLDLTVYGQGGAAPKDAAAALAEAILASGPVTAVPADKGPADGLYLEGSMCDVFSPDEVNAITGGSYGPLDLESEADDPNCTYQGPAGFVIFVLSTDYGRTVDTGTYTSEDLVVAGRPAIWDSVQEFLTLDAGDGRTLAVGFSANEPDPATRRDQAIAIAEAIIPKLSSEAPPVPESAECDAPLDELSRITGVELVAGMPLGAVCFYTSGSSSQQGVVIGVLAGDDPAAALEAAGFTSEVAPAPTDVDGRAALVVDAPEGSSLAVDLDGTPGGDGQVLVVVVGGLAEGSDQLAIATEVVRYLIAQR
jgi:hypothetical protein